MSPVKYLITEGANGDNILVAGTTQDGDAYVRSVAPTAPRWDDIKSYLENTREEDTDGDLVLRMVDAGELLLNGITKLSERVMLRGESIYFDGDLLDNSLSKHIVRMVQSGDDNYKGFVRFLENLATNPSRKARRQLFTWINDRKFTITEDGMFMAYKGVQNHPDNLSISSGVETVWVNGVAHTGHIPNPIGATIEMARSNVDDDTHRGCSTGLHAGTHRYADNFGRKLLYVVINPRDVVSVPKDSAFEKLRVCRYTVVDYAKGQIEDTTYQGSNTWNPDLEDESAQCGDCGSSIEESANVDGLCDDCRYNEDDYYSE